MKPASRQYYELRVYHAATDQQLAETDKRFGSLITTVDRYIRNSRNGRNGKK